MKTFGHIQKNKKRMGNVKCQLDFEYVVFLSGRVYRGQNARLSQVPITILLHSQPGHFQNARVSQVQIFVSSFSQLI